MDSLNSTNDSGVIAGPSDIPLLMRVQFAAYMKLLTIIFAAGWPNWWC